jgi:hypothetical protein
MSKPIFIVRFPYSLDLKESFEHTTRWLQSKLPDYHVLPLIENHTEKVEFECYNAINATDKEIEEIKEMVLKQLGNE